MIHFTHWWKWTSFTESNPKTLNSNEIDDIYLWICLKDKYNISDQAWKELAMKANDMPNAYWIKKNTTDLNAKWKLKPTPGEAEVQISLKDSLKEQIQRLKIKGDLGEQETVRVNMSGDGTNVRKRLKLVNFTYTIWNEKENAISEKGNYVLAIVKTEETYDNLKESLSDIKTEMAQSNEIEVDNVKLLRVSM